MFKGRRNRLNASILLKSFFIVLCLVMAGMRSSAMAEDSLCAKVKIEIKQELTLERQAFDAHMRINNGLTHVSLENISVEVLFTDNDGNSVLATSNPDDTSALFFIRLDSMANIDNVGGTGSVPAASTADIHWLIIPAPGASNGLEQGTRYNVGARLIYTVGGEENVTEVSPDYIFVKPMPELTLDYFLPTDVYGDDAFTPEIEPSVPFSLGVRVKNNGSGVARGLKIDSAQPRIVENEQGLLINFVIDGSEVNGDPVSESLLVDFGDIPPATAGVARWIMRCSLSGRFVNFEARFSHADELGGELTSLIEAVNTHFLVRDVLVDLPGRDAVRDFLAKDGDIYRIYESDSADVVVTDGSASAGLVAESGSGTESRYTLSGTPAAGFTFIRLNDPHAGEKALTRVIRSDGKIIKPENAWLSKKRNRDDQTWYYYVNLFDADTTGGYTLTYDDIASLPHPPVLQFIPDRSGIEGGMLSFLVEASDPDSTVPALSAAPLPVGAAFTDNGDGTALFSWSPAVGQKGSYAVIFSASDGGLQADQRVRLTIYDIGDTDMDGMLDAWEMKHFGTLDRDGTGDFDGDGISDLQEFLDGTDPALDEAAPSTPEPLYPLEYEDVTIRTPELVIANSEDRQSDEISYDFEVFSDPEMTRPVAAQTGVAEGDEIAALPVYQWLADGSGDPPLPTPRVTTSWPVSNTLADNNRYYWRVRSTDGEGYSLWAYWSFFLNTGNDPPAAFQIAEPAQNAEVDTLTPRLVVMNSRDIDNNIITYDFEVYSDNAMTMLVTGATDIPEGTDGATAWAVNTALNDHTTYYWRAIAVDEHGAQTQTPLMAFHTNTTNQAPVAPTVADTGTGGIEKDGPSVVLKAGNATDAENTELFQEFEIDTAPGFDSPAKKSSGLLPQGAGSTTWSVSDLEENTRYYWRVRATDGAAYSPWVRSSFLVNHINEAPGTPTMKNPGVQAWVGTRTPVLSVNPTTDPDMDTLSYQFEVYSNETLTKFVAGGEGSGTDWTLSWQLQNNRRYYWRARAMDEHGVPGAWTQVSDFFVALDIVNAAPEITLTEPAADLLTNSAQIDISWEDVDADSNASVALCYDTDDSGLDGVLIASGLAEDPDGTADTYTWDVGGIPDGTYYIYAVISDEDGTANTYAAGRIILDRTPPMITAGPPAGSFSDAQNVTLTTDVSVH